MLKDIRCIHVLLIVCYKYIQRLFINKIDLFIFYKLANDMITECEHKLFAI